MTASRRDPDDQGAATAHLRARILTGIHTGELNPGDRLPTYRELAGEFGEDLRRVARAYRQLEAEGLVEIRGRSGVYAASQERIGGKVLATTARWVVGVLAEGWTRRIHVPDFPAFVESCISTVQVRCGCIEATEDQLVALCHELRAEFGFDTHSVNVASLPAERAGRPDELPAALREADILVTTAFSAGPARRLAAELKKPLVLVRLSRELVREIERHLRSGVLYVVCVDPRFAERVRRIGGGEHAENVRVVLASDRKAVRALPPDRPVLVTRAARQRIRGVPLPPGIATFPSIARDSAEQLVELLVRLNLEAMSKDSE
jgi:DNA-binding transcriptional regulator YhcF (GntR family)